MCKFANRPLNLLPKEAFAHLHIRLFANLIYA
jgi:hypothetical protein